MTTRDPLDAILLVTMNLLVLVLIPLQLAGSTRPGWIDAVQMVVWMFCFTSFLRYCVVKLGTRLAERAKARRLAEMEKALSILIAQIKNTFGKDAAFRFVASLNAVGNPIDNYYRNLVVEEACRRNKTLHGYFDDDRHFVMSEVGDPVDVSALAGEMEHPPPDLADDLDNSWEPPS